MSKLTAQTVNSLREVILAAMGRAVAGRSASGRPPPPAFSIEVPADRSHGDYSANAAMVSARPL